jgi:hypothetical protein
MATSPSREGKRQIGVYVDPSVKQALVLLAVEKGSTVQSLLEEALTLLFAAHGKECPVDLVTKEPGKWTEAALANHKSRKPKQDAPA